MITWILATIIIVYCLLIYVVTRIVVPFMGWRGFERPKAVPQEIRIKIAELESQAQSQEDYLKLVYDFVLHKTKNQWNHTRFRAFYHIPRAFVKSLEEIWNTKDFLYCTGINYLVYVLLAESKFFRPEDVKVRHVFVNFFIHQYIKVKVGSAWVSVDPAGTGIRGKPLGTHLAGFG